MLQIVQHIFGLFRRPNRESRTTGNAGARQPELRSQKGILTSQTVVVGDDNAIPASEPRILEVEGNVTGYQGQNNADVSPISRRHSLSTHSPMKDSRRRLSQAIRLKKSQSSLRSRRMHAFPGLSQRKQVATSDERCELHGKTTTEEHDSSGATAIALDPCFSFLAAEKTGSINQSVPNHTTNDHSLLKKGNTDNRELEPDFPFKGRLRSRKTPTATTTDTISVSHTSASSLEHSATLVVSSNLQVASVPDLSEHIIRISRRPIFQGTYSSIFEGSYNDQKVAIKALRIVASAETMRRKFTREVTIWFQLSHPNVLRLLGLAESDDYGRFPAMISPWCRNGHSGDYIRQEVTLSARVDLFHQVTQALRYLHTFDPILVHGDLKPQNVLIDNEGVAKLCDFGLIRLIHDGPRTGMTTTTAHTGTMRYLSYELVKGFGYNTPTTSSDIYALGCLGMEFIYLDPPYFFIPSKDVYGIPVEIRNGTPPAQRPLKLENESESALWDLLEACWTMDPSERPNAEYVCEWIGKWKESLIVSLSQQT